MMQFNIKITGVQEALKTLNPKIVQRVTSRTLNDLSSAIKTQTAKQIRETYTITSERIKDGIRLTQKATPQKLSAIVTFGEKVPGLQQYSMRATQPKRTKKGYKPPLISVAVKKRQRKILRQVFLVPNKIGIFAVGEYKGGRFIHIKGRRPINRLLGPSIKGMFRATGGYEKAQKVVNERINGIFERQLKNELYRARRQK
jgi:hypothetical protein